MLPMKLPVGLGNRIDVQQSVGAAFDSELRRGRVEFLAIDAAVDDDMGDVNSERTEFARHRLRQRTKRSLAGCERREGRLPSQARGSAGKDDGTVARRRQSPGGFPSHQE